ncbi:MAG: hypothetical protein K940chlam5_00144 [Candidatus Anoxychlamydiales bacterium]|nr:hypothetical protein [Candidatus Anoxychlamydiales bacterium]
MKLIATEGPLKGQVLDLKEKDEWILGRDPTECSFLLEDTTVSRKHAKIYKTKDGYVIKNLSTTNPIEVNDERVDEYILEENDKLKIGDTLFVYTALEEADLKEEPKEEVALEEVSEEKEAPSPKEDDDDEEEIEEEKEKIKEPTDETIFEAEEETPLSLLIDAPFILKVISGSNAGSEFGMEKSKSFIIGKDVAQADIIFSDMSVSKQNTKITIDENSDIFVEDLGSKNGTYVNNKKIEEKTKITPHDLITLGTTTFLVIEKEAAQETIYSPAPTFEVEEEKKEEKEELAKKTIWKKQFIPTRHLIFAGSFIIIFFIIFLSFFGLFRAKDIEVVKKMPTEKIQNIIKDYDTIEFSFNDASANLFLVGHVLTSIDKQELMYDLKALSFIKNIEDNIVIDEITVKNFNDSLNEEASFRSVFSLANKPGNYVLDGYVKTAANYSGLSSFVNSNFPYLDKLENRVVIDQILQVQIATLLTKNGFTLSFEMISGKLVLAGRYNKKQASSYKALMQEFLKTPGIHSIKNLAIPSDGMMARIDLTSKYKITGWAKYDGHNSVVANGKIIISGDTLDGMDVTNVSENAILLEKDDIKYKINYSP